MVLNTKFTFSAMVGAEDCKTVGSGTIHESSSVDLVGHLRVMWQFAGRSAIMYLDFHFKKKTLAFILCV